MAFYNFIPYTTLEIGVNFRCLNCGEEIEGCVSVPQANMDGDGDAVEHTVDYGDIQCSNCQRNYGYSIVSDGTIEIPEINNEEIHFIEFDLEKEYFKDCPFNPTLKVSQYGNVLNSRTNELVTKRKLEGCYIVDDPRGRIQYDNGSRDYEWVHRLVALTWLNDSPYYMDEVHHRDDNGLNNRIDNLEWVNRELHKKRHGN
ncbi:MAG: HNH endonuclease [Spirochaetaceae bacterium]|jgi:hypothetical protein|nr:HNH endonuclease [Spirochaetaceae bacterium]